MNSEEEMMESKQLRPRHVKATAVLLLVSVGGFGSAIAAASESSFDGLVTIENTVADRIWVRPDFDLSGYTKLIVQPVGIQYRPVKQVSRVAASRADAFPMTEQQKARLVEVVSEEFDKALSELTRYEIVTASGADVLLLRGALLDVVSRVPPDQPGRTEFYLNSVGDATLLIELADSQSGAVLVRVLDRRAAAQHGYAQRSNPVTNSAEVRRVARSWADLLVKRLEHVSDLSSISDR